MQPAGAKSIAITSPPSGVDEGWDAADALEESWTTADTTTAARRCRDLGLSRWLDDRQWITAGKG